MGNPGMYQGGARSPSPAPYSSNNRNAGVSPMPGAPTSNGISGETFRKY